MPTGPTAPSWTEAPIQPTGAGFTVPEHAEPDGKATESAEVDELCSTQGRTKSPRVSPSTAPYGSLGAGFIVPEHAHRDGKSTESADVDELCSTQGKTKSPRVGPTTAPQGAIGYDGGRVSDAPHRSGDSAGQECEWRGLAQSADLLASRGKHLEALKLVDEAIDICPIRAELHCGRGQCLNHLGNFQDALNSYERAFQLDPGSLAAFRGKATVLTRESRWAAAAECLRAALQAISGGKISGIVGADVIADMRHELARCLTEQGVQCKTAGHPNPQLFQEAVEACELFAPAHFQIGVEASETGKAAIAKEAYKKAVQLRPEYMEAWNNLGVACRTLCEPDHAVEAYSMAFKINQNCKKTRENMAVCLLEQGCKTMKEKDRKKASNILKRALTFSSTNADIYFNLGVLYAERHKWDRAKVHYELCVHFAPGHATAYNNLGVIHRRLGNVEAAVKCFEEALKTDSKMNLANKNFGAICGAMGRMSEAISFTRTALETSPEDAEAYNNLALLYRDQCDVDACLDNLVSCLKLEPDNCYAASNRLMSLNYPSGKTAEEVFSAHRQWGENIESKVEVQFRSYKANPGGGLSDPPLRVGYISPDFYTHSVSYFIHAALRYHDPAFVHVTCYSDVANEDGKTELFKSLVPRWRNIFGKTDDEVAEIIHGDGIDVLVELTGHTGNNRLAMLARRPAPVIVSWIGYPHTTGLSRVDYRISDERVDPPAAPGYTTETLVYLPECFLCYTPPENAPSLCLKPAQESYGAITFGCFNNLAKVSATTIRTWARLLHEVPNSRLFLKSKALLCGNVQDKFRKAFAGHGIEACRLDLSGLQPQTGSHLQMYGLVDVALDTAPYAGTTTTCEAFYMGVPVVSLRAPRIHAHNVGASLLAAVQLEDLACDTEDEFVQKAAALARHTTRLAALRAGLRARMLRSVLCDGPRHAARLERLLTKLANQGTVKNKATSDAAVAAESDVGNGDNIHFTMVEEECARAIEEQ